MQKIKLTDGCPNQCNYCYEGTMMKYYPMPEIKEKNIQILDMNFLANPEANIHIEELGSKKCKTELVCGVDFRLMSQKMACLLKDNGFIKIRWAWDYSFAEGQKIHKKIWEMFTKAGYRPNDLSIFILVNWKISFADCIKKLDLLKIWNVKVNDCCYDGGYKIKTKREYDNEQYPRFWSYSELKQFRRMCRKHNQMVLFKIDPEIK